ncbi:transposase [Methanobrevibacter sp.]|uniref:transposase n=1 Tax=Methanobrevibacter sp. TaxID=66852 RepID=UPI00388E700E
MVKRKFDKNQIKLGIRTLDWNVLKDHISRFVVDFIEDVFSLLEIDEPKKKKGRESLPVDSMLKLLVYAKIQHIDRASIIEDMARYHDIFRFVCDDIRPSERSIQRYRREYGRYFEVLLQMTLRHLMKVLLNLITLLLMELLKKHIIPTTTQSLKKKPKY